jgi:integrase/recombinase XerD
MLEQYFFKPSTIDRLRGSWIATVIEAYVAWLAEQGYGAKTVWRRVPIGFAFGEFAWERGARTVGDLPAHVEAFVAARVAAHHAIYSSRPMTKEVRGPVEQMLSVAVAGFEPAGRPHHRPPFVDVAPGFFDYLAE